LFKLQPWQMRYTFGMSDGIIHTAETSMTTQAMVYANEIAPPRFRTMEDAMLFLHCVRTRTDFPPEKWIRPYEEINGLATISREYREAPFEARYIVGPREELVSE
jgi:hypothetical protein